MRAEKAADVIESNGLWRSKKLDLVKVIRDAEVKPMTTIQRIQRPNALGLFDPKEPRIIRINTGLKFTDEQLVRTLLHEGIHRRDFLLGKKMPRSILEYKAYRSSARFTEENLGLSLDWREMRALKGREIFMRDVAQHRRWDIP